MTKPNPNARKPTPIAVGMRFGRWTVAAQSSPTKGGQKRWICRCDCGNEKVVPAHYLRGGDSRSCECLMRELAGSRARTHGLRGTSEWIAWQAMVQRCTRETHPAFKTYGGRGIRVCDEWRGDFAAFLAHIGTRPSSSHSLDRINNERGYEPGNVQWATRSEQARNRRERVRNEEGRFA